MVRMCVVGRCSNRKTEEISLHHFPTEQFVREQWIKAVNSTRKNWKGPSKNTVVCSTYFDEGCFEAAYDLKRSMRMKGSVPSNFVRSRQKPVTTNTKKSTPGASLDLLLRNEKDRE